MSKDGVSLPFSFFPPRQLFACLFLSRLPHYSRAWNRLAWAGYNAGDVIACVAGVLKGKGKEFLGKGVLGARETLPPSLLARLSRLPRRLAM